jgi:hypothetical protein
MATTPKWPLDLISLGYEFACLSTGQSDLSWTLALCLPCVDYASAFLGLGILKARLEENESTGEERMRNLLGRYVICEGKSNLGKLGFLEYCEINKDFKITEFSRKNSSFSWVLNEEDWSKITPVGLSFNRERRLSASQIKHIEEEAISVMRINRLFQCGFGNAIFENPRTAFIVRGNKARIFEEITNPLSLEGNPILESVLRPRYEDRYSSSFHCSIESIRASIDNKDNDSIIIIEADRNLPDELISSRKKNRIIIMGRNTVSYDDSASQVIEAFSRRHSESKLSAQQSSVINTLLFSSK